MIEGYECRSVARVLIEGFEGSGVRELGSRRLLGLQLGDLVAV